MSAVFINKVPQASHQLENAKYSAKDSYRLMNITPIKDQNSF